MRPLKTVLLLAITCSFWACSEDDTGTDEDNTNNVKLKTFSSCEELGGVIGPFIEQKTNLTAIKINPELEPDNGEIVTAYYCKWELPADPPGSLSDGETLILGKPKTLLEITPNNHTLIFWKRHRHSSRMSMNFTSLKISGYPTMS